MINTPDKKIKVNCNICGIDDTEVILTKEGSKIVKCRQCGLVYTNPRSMSLELQYHKKEYFTIDDRKTGKKDYFDEHSIWYDTAHFSANLDEIEKLKKGKKLLDVGCGIGRFIKMAKKRGWKVKGVDVSEYAVEKAKEEGLEVYSGHLKDMKFDKEEFDVITMFHVLEHLENPVEFLSGEVFHFLKSDGILVIEVPNFGSSSATKLGKNWPWLLPESHLYYFTKETIQKLLNKSGFHILKMLTKNVADFGGLHDIGEVKYYKKLSDSKLGFWIKSALHKTNLWNYYQSFRDNCLIKVVRPFKKPEPRDKDEILLFAQKIQ